MPPIFRADENTQYHVDELVYVTSGDYSSYSIDFIARVRRDFDARTYILHNGYFERLDTTRLFAEGVLEELPARELFSG